MRKLHLAALAAATLGFPGIAHADPITGNGAPSSNVAFTNPTLVDFEDVLQGYYLSLTTHGVTISSSTPIQVSQEFPGYYNTSGASLNNQHGQTAWMDFSFANPVSAFAFNFGASDDAWNIIAYSNGTPVEVYQIAPTGGSNDQAYFGLSGASIDLIRLSENNGSLGDWVLIDNLTYTTTATLPGGVPEPAAWGMMIGGFALAGAAMRRTRKSKVSFA